MRRDTFIIVQHCLSLLVAVQRPQSVCLMTGCQRCVVCNFSLVAAMQ